MQVDATNLLLGFVPAIISYLIAMNNSKKQIESIREETERDILKIKEDTRREIEKIEADTKREIGKIEADTERQTKIIEMQSKSKENEKMTDLVYEVFGSVISDPKRMESLLKLGKISNPTDEDFLELFK